MTLESCRISDKAWIIVLISKVKTAVLVVYRRRTASLIVAQTAYA